MAQLRRWRPQPKPKTNVSFHTNACFIILPKSSNCIKNNNHEDLKINSKIYQHFIVSRGKFWTEKPPWRSTWRVFWPLLKESKEGIELRGWRGSGGGGVSQTHYKSKCVERSRVHTAHQHAVRAVSVRHPSRGRAATRIAHQKIAWVKIKFFLS